MDNHKETYIEKGNRIRSAIRILKESAAGIELTELQRVLNVSHRTAKRYIMRIREDHAVVDFRRASNVPSKYSILNQEKAA